MKFYNQPLSDDEAHEIETVVRELIAKSPETFAVLLMSCHNQLIASSDMPEGLEPLAIGNYVLDLFTKSGDAIRQMNHDRLEQVVAKTADGTVVIATDFGGGVLVSLSKQGNANYHGNTVQTVI